MYDTEKLTTPKLNYPNPWSTDQGSLRLLHQRTLVRVPWTTVNGQSTP